MIITVLINYRILCMQFYYKESLLLVGCDVRGRIRSEFLNSVENGVRQLVVSEIVFIFRVFGGSIFELLPLDYVSFELLFILTTDNDVISCSSNNT